MSNALVKVDAESWVSFIRYLLLLQQVQYTAFSYTMLQNLTKTKQNMYLELKHWKFQNILATIGELLRSRKVVGRHSSVEEAEPGMVEGQGGEGVQVRSEQDGEGVHCAGAACTLCTVKEVGEAELQQDVLLLEEEKADMQVGQEEEAAQNL